MSRIIRSTVNKNGDTMVGPLSVNNSSANSAIQVTQAGNASALSINITGTGTTAQGVYVDSDSNTTGNLLRLRNGGVDVFVVDSNGIATTPNTLPTDAGFITWAYDPAGALNTQILQAAGTMYVVKVKVHVPKTVTSISIYISTAGATLTSGQCFAALYQGGSLIGTTADQATNWQTAGLKTMSLSGGPYTLNAGTAYVGFWANGTTLPTLCRASGFTIVNAGYAGTASRFGSANTGLTTTAPGSLGTVSALGVAYWAGLS